MIEVRHRSPNDVAPREERELFRGFVEDYNTATMPNDKYYNIEKWHQSQRAAGDDDAADDMRGLTDEQVLAWQRAAARIEDAKRLESERVYRLRQELSRAKESGGEDWNRIVARNEASMIAPTFESIAKARENIEKERIAKLKQNLNKKRNKMNLKL